MEPTPQITDESSVADIATLFGGGHPSEPPKAEPETKPTEPEAAKPADGKSPESAAVPDDKKPTEQSSAKAEKPEEDEPLPPGVQKRIDREIAKVVQLRKDAEAKLAEISSKTGTEPAKSAEPEITKPVRPDLDTFEGTMGEYMKALDKYDEEREAWVLAQAGRKVEQELTQRQQEADSKREWDAAVKKHGAEFRELTETVAKNSPEELQRAISALDNWSDVAAHLAKHPDELKAFAERIKSAPLATIAALGKLEAELMTPAKPEPVQKKSPEKPLPQPPEIVGGKAGASAEPINYETASISDIERDFKKRRAG